MGSTSNITSNHNILAKNVPEGISTNMITVKAMYERVGHVEHHLGKLCNLFSNYNLKCASVRDKNDQVAKGIAKFALDESSNSTTKLALTMASELIGCVGDHINAKVLRLESKLLPPLSSYGSICKHLKADLKKAISAEEKLQSRKVDLDKLTNKMSDMKIQSVISLAETEFDKAEAESSRMNFLCQENMLKFENKRLQDLKESLLMFFKIEIAYHAKSLELVSNAYHAVSCIDEADDLKNFKSSLGLGIRDFTSKTKPHGSVKKNRYGTNKFGKKRTTSTISRHRQTFSDGEVSLLASPTSTPRKVKFEVENSDEECTSSQQNRTSGHKGKSQLGNNRGYGNSSNRTKTM